jgi:hypothetical protein
MSSPPANPFGSPHAGPGSTRAGSLSSHPSNSAAEASIDARKNRRRVIGGREPSIRISIS